MNNKIVTIFIAAILMSNVSFANIFRVGFTGPKIDGVDFTLAQAAHDAASAGDTLLLFPGSHSLGATKKLVYLGYGYYTSGTTGNANLQVITGPCTLSANLMTGASGSTFEGIENLTANANNSKSVDDITIRRCKGMVGPYANTGTICNNWRILQCASLNIQNQSTYGGGKTTNLLVENSEIVGLFSSGQYLMNGLFSNCVISIVNYTSNIDNNGFNFQNCIFQYTPPIATTSNALFQNCLFPDADPGFSGSNNKFSVPLSTGTTNKVFTGYPNVVAGQSADGKYTLKAGSPAIGAGIGGTDMGIFGGTNPYRLSGIPSTPAFYKLTAPGINATTNPYTITFSVRSNN